VNVLKPHQKGAVITLLENGVSQHEISRKTGIDRKTVRKLALSIVAARAGVASNSPMATGSDGLPVQIPPPRPPAPGARSPPVGLPAHARSACEEHREWIEAQVRLGRNATAIYQELVDRFGFTPRYNSVKRFCRALRSREPEQFDRLEFLAGE
jgi:transposase